MKKKLSFLIALICAIVCVFSLAACGGSPAKPTDVTGKKYVFLDYKIEYSSNFPDEMKYPQGVLEEIKEHYKDTYIHFFTDGTVEMSAGQAATGTYTQTDKDVVITLGGRTLKGTATGDKFELKNLVTLPGSEYQASEIYIYKLDEESSLPPDQGEVIDPEVSQEAWTAAFEQVEQSLSSMKWTLISSDSSMTGTICYDPAKGMSITEEYPADGETVNRNSYELMEKSDGKYYVYSSEDGKSWTRREVTEEDYQTSVNMVCNPNSAVMLICSGLAQCYSSFTLTDGVYSASNVTVSPVGEAQHVSVTFADGALIEIDITVREGFTISLKFGVAEFEIPTNFTESTMVN